MTYRPPVLDSYALVAYLEGESCAEAVESALEQAREREYALPVSVINWGEVLYIQERSWGLEGLRRAIAVIDELPIALVDADRHLTLSAARIKAAGQVSYADAHCCALALALGAPVMTGDPEFASVEGVEVVWLSDS
jgi:predicted nucleic acid-binding protein